MLAPGLEVRSASPRTSLRCIPSQCSTRFDRALRHDNEIVKLAFRQSRPVWATERGSYGRNVSSSRRIELKLTGSPPGGDVQRATSFVVLWMDGRLQEFASGPRDFAAADAAALGVTLAETYFHQRLGVLRVGSADRVDPGSDLTETVWLGAWEGSRSSLRTVLYSASALEVIALFDTLSIYETAEGVAIEPVDSKRVSFDRTPGHAPCVLHHVPALGLLDVAERTREVERALPRGRGKQVANGRLFSWGTSGAEVSLILLGETTVTRIIPERDAGESDVIAGVSRLDAAWRRAA